MSDESKDKCYLGDGLYATFDGWQIILRTPRNNGEHWVALDPEVFTTLVHFANGINNKYGQNIFVCQKISQGNDHVFKGNAKGTGGGW